jgi:hypothetical protein
MWQEDDSSGQFSPDDERRHAEPPSQPDLRGEDSDEKDVRGQGGQFPGNIFPPAALPHMVPVMDIYEAARARAVADQQLSKLFNPEYYI